MLPCGSLGFVVSAGFPFQVLKLASCLAAGDVLHGHVNSVSNPHVRQHLVRANTLSLHPRGIGISPVGNPRYDDKQDWRHCLSSPAPGSTSCAATSDCSMWEGSTDHVPLVGGVAQLGTLHATPTYTCMHVDTDCR